MGEAKSGVYCSGDVRDVDAIRRSVSVGSVKEGDSLGGIPDSSFEDGVQCALVVVSAMVNNDLVILVNARPWTDVDLEHRWTYSSSSNSSSKKAHDSLIEPKRPVGSLPSPRGGASETNDGQVKIDQHELMLNWHDKLIIM
ncbi:hypothetical protein Tco_0154917 [Tanacetum coccineum]